jgi:hypothetical protein
MTALSGAALVGGAAAPDAFVAVAAGLPRVRALKKARSAGEFHGIAPSLPMPRVSSTATTRENGRSSGGALKLGEADEDAGAVIAILPACCAVLIAKGVEELCGLRSRQVHRLRAFAVGLWTNDTCNIARGRMHEQPVHHTEIGDHGVSRGRDGAAALPRDTPRPPRPADTAARKLAQSTPSRKAQCWELAVYSGAERPRRTPTAPSTVLSAMGSATRIPRTLPRCLHSYDCITRDRGLAEGEGFDEGPVGGSVPRDCAVLADDRPKGNFARFDWSLV